MRKIIRFLVALILGLIAFTAIVFWPERPLWTKPVTKIAIVSFTDDEKQLLILEGMHRLGLCKRGTDLQLVRYDVESGYEKQRTKINIPQDYDRLNVSASANGERLLFFGYHNGPTRMDYHCYLFDDQSGQCLGGPWECVDFRDVVISPCGRWICHPGKKYPGISLDIISTENGKPLLSLPTMQRNGQKCFSRFSRDGSKLAFLTPEHGMRVLKFVSLPSGEMLHNFQLPDYREVSLCDWTDNLFSLLYSSSGSSPRNQEIRSYQLVHNQFIPLEQKPSWEMVNDDLAYSSISVISTSTIICQVRQGKAAWPDYYLRFCEWSDKHLGTHRSANLFQRTTFRCLDRQTGDIRLDIPVDQIINPHYGIPALNTMFSPSGRFFASYSGDSPQLTLWNVVPKVRWPWALGAALLTILVFYSLQSLRRLSIRGSMPYTTSP